MGAGGQTMTRDVTWVVPCYGEAERFRGAGFVSLVDAEPDISLLFVDDGSTDETAAKLFELSNVRPSAVRALSLEQNVGKAEAVRRGLVRALHDGALVVGYLDADLATPVAEMLRLTKIIRERDLDVVFGARVALLGRQIGRHSARHYAGRVFATAASLILRLRVYDTQCGAKVFKRSPALESALATPFLSRWAFDVELFGRLLSGTPPIPPDRMLEEPLLEWNDVPGSKVSARDIVMTGVDLVRISRDLSRRREQT
jgi:glycosyltransferase involved in cell wall biosynthesis